MPCRSTLFCGSSCCGCSESEEEVNEGQTQIEINVPQRESFSESSVVHNTNPTAAFSYSYCNRERLQGRQRHYHLNEINYLLVYYPGQRQQGAFAHIVELDDFERADTRENIGWKLHISIHYDDIPKAWNQVIVPLFLRYGLKEVKIISRDDWETMPVTTGREITIYLFRHKADELISSNKLQRFCQEMEGRLVEKRIRPNKCPAPCQVVTGSKYLYYRNDIGLDGQYVKADEAGNYNPSNKPDVYDLQGLTVGTVPRPRELADVPQDFSRNPNPPEPEIQLPSRRALGDIRFS